MNFIHIITSLESGGTEKNLLNFIKFGGNKNSHVVFVLKPGGFFEKGLSKKVKVYSPQTGSIFSLIHFLFFMRTFCKNYMNEKTFIQSWNYQSNLISIIIKSKKKIWQIRSSGEKIFTSPKRLLYVFLNGIFSLFAKKIIFNSYKSREQHKKFFLNKKLIVIQNGFQIKAFRGKIKKTKKINFICIARNDYYKDHDNLIRAFILFDKKFKDWTLHIIGKGNLKLLEKYNLDKAFKKKIIILDEKINLEKYLLISDFHVLSSLGESFPNVIGETMSKGILNIATDVGDIEFLIKDKKFLVKPENSIELANALLNAKNLYLKNFSKFLKKKQNAIKLIKEKYNYQRYFSQIIQECKSALNKKYLFVLPTLNGGGAERVTTEIMKSINNIDNSLITDLLVTGKKTDIDYEKIFRGEVFYLNHKRSFYSFFSVKKFINENDYNVVFSNIPNINALLNILKLFIFKKFFLISRESNMPFEPLKHQLSLKNSLNFLLRFFYFNSDLIICPSKKIYKSLNKILFFKRSNKFLHVPNYIDYQNHYYNSKVKLENKIYKSNYILNISNISFQKNLEYSIEIFRTLINDIPDYKLLVIGKVVNQDYYEKLLKLIQKYNLKNSVYFLGFKKNPYSIIKRAKLIICTSRWEGMPNSLLQSVSLNKKIISVDCVSGPSEIKENGFYINLIKSNDPKIFAEKVKKILNNKMKINNKNKIIDYNKNYLKNIKEILNYDFI